MVQSGRRVPVTKVDPECRAQRIPAMVAVPAFSANTSVSGGSLSRNRDLEARAGLKGAAYGTKMTIGMVVETPVFQAVLIRLRKTKADHADARHSKSHRLLCLDRWSEDPGRACQ
jgi:hypothetical protein